MDLDPTFVIVLTIAVGILVTILFKGGGDKGSESASSGSSSSGAQSSSSKKKNKNKNKNKSKKKASEKTDSTDTEATESSSSSSKSGKKKNKKKNKSKKSGKKEEEEDDGSSSTENKKPEETKKNNTQDKSKKSAVKSFMLEKSKIVEQEEEWEIVGKPEKTSGASGSSKKEPAPQEDHYSNDYDDTTSDANKPTTSTSKMYVDVESKQVGVIIGPKGVTLHKLQDATNTKISVPPNSSEMYGPVKVCVEGPPDQVKRCAEAIKDLCTKGMSRITHGDYKEGTVQVHPDYVPLIIGYKGRGLKGGETIRALQERCGVNIVMPTGPNPFKKPLYVKLLGSPAGVDKCKAAIKELMRYYHTDVAHPGIKHLELDINDAEHSIIIGKRGQTIRGIEGNTGAKINIPRPTSINSKVVITGTPSQIDAAKKQVDNALRKYHERDQLDPYEHYDDNDYDDDDDAMPDDDYDYSQHVRS